MKEIVTNAQNLEEWLRELEIHEQKEPEDQYYVKVSVKLMCMILRMAKEPA